MDQFIVAEISRNWNMLTPPSKPLLSQQFEELINTNDRRGYKLVEWKIDRMIVPSEYMNFPAGLNETIIAIFEKKEV